MRSQRNERHCAEISKAENEPIPINLGMDLMNVMPLILQIITSDLSLASQFTELAL